LVQEGDRVRSGQALIEISSKLDSLAIGDTQAAIEVQLDIKERNLNNDLLEQEASIRRQQQDLGARIATLNEQVAEKESQVLIQVQRAKNAAALYKEWLDVADAGIVSRVQLTQQHDITLRAEAELSHMRGEVLQLRQYVADARANLAQLPSSLARQRSESVRQLADVRQLMASNAEQSAVVIRASVEGIVSNVLVNRGQSVKSQQSLLTVLPKDASLYAQLWVPTEAVGFIRPGKAVKIRYRSFPYQKFGQFTAQVKRVSNSATSPDELSTILGRRVDDPRYQVEVSLDQQYVSAYGRKEHLRPGMALDAVVLLDRRHLYEWVFEPVLGLSKQAYRDSLPIKAGL